MKNPRKNLNRRVPPICASYHLKFRQLLGYSTLFEAQTRCLGKGRKGEEKTRRKEKNASAGIHWKASMSSLGSFSVERVKNRNSRNLRRCPRTKIKQAFPALARKLSKPFRPSLEN